MSKCPLCEHDNADGRHFQSTCMVNLCNDKEKFDELCRMVEAMDRKIQEANNLAITYISEDLREEFNGIVDFVVNHCGD